MSTDDAMDHAAPTPAANKPARHRWRRRLKIAAYVLLLGVLLMRILTIFALPIVLAKVAGYYNLDIKYDRQTLALLGGHAGLWNVRIYPKGGGEPLLTSEYMQGDIVPWRLLTGKLYVIRAEADAVDLVIERTADGRVPLLQQLASMRSAQVAAANAQPQAIDFTSPLRIEALRLNKIDAHLRDKAIQPPLDTSFAMDLRVSEIGAARGPTSFEIDAWSETVLDSLHVDGEAIAAGRSLDGRAHVVSRGLHPGPLAGYLQPLGIKPIAQSLGMEAQADIHIRPATGSADAISASCAIDKMHFWADENEFASLDAIHITADQIDANGVKFGPIVVEGGRFSASRDENGLLRVAGFEVSPAGWMSGSSSPSRYTMSFGDVYLHDLQALFTDESMQPATNLKAVLADFSAKTLAANGEIDVKGKFAMPGIVRTIQLDGAILPTKATKTATLNFRADGMRPDAIRSVLASLGVESQWKDASASGAVHLESTTNAAGNVIASAKLLNLRLTDGDELAALDHVNINGLSVDPKTGKWHVDAIDGVGPTLSVSREPNGAIATCGLTFSGFGKSPAPAATPQAPAKMPSLPPIEIGQIAWKGVKLNLTDLATPNAAPVSIADAGLEIKNLLLDFSSKTPAEKTGQIHAWITSPQLAKGGLTIDGTMTPGVRSLAADLKVRGGDLNPSVLTPYLKSLGIEPQMTQAQLALDATLGVIGGADGSVSASADLNDVSLRNGGDEIVGVDQIKFDSVALGAGQLAIGNVTILHPRTSAARDAKGGLTVAGTKINLQQLAAPPATAPPSTQPYAVVNTGGFVATLKQLHLENAQVQWTDRAVAPAVNTTLYASANVANLTVGRRAQAGTFDAQLSCEGIVDDIKASGEIDPSPGAQALKLQVAANGVRGKAIDPYLPPNIRSSFADGRFRATILASSDVHPLGGRSAYVDVMNLDWRDGPMKPLLWLRLARIAATRIDWPNDDVEIDEIALDGVDTSAALGADGNLHLPGFNVVAAPPVTESPAAIPAAFTISPTAQPSADISPLAGESHRQLPLILLHKLDLNIHQVTLTDQRRPAAAPVVLRDVHVQNSAPIVIGGPFADAQKPAQIVVNGTIEPAVKQFTLTISANLSADEPVASLDLLAAGIQGGGIDAIVPEISKNLDGSAMQDGQFHVAATIHARLHRRYPRDIDLSRPLDLDLVVKDTTFRDAAGGPVVGGVDSIQADSIHIDPQTSSIHIKALQIDKPTLLALRDTNGVHVMGFIIRPSTQPTTQPSNNGSEDQGTHASDSQLTEAENGARTASKQILPSSVQTAGGEFAIDRLIISGADIRAEDIAVDPPLMVPINSLNVEVRDLDTAALHEDRPIRFNALIGTTPDAPPTAQEGATTQPSRPLFSQVTASGSISLYPTLHGYAKTSLSGLELTPFRGEARAQGVDLTSGVLDADVAARFRDEGSLDLQSKFVATDLHLTEPKDGPIQRHLGLSAPLDVVLVAIRDPDGAITIPLNVPVEAGKISTGNIVAAASGALVQILVTAVASAPVKSVALVGNATGINKLTGFWNKSDANLPSIIKLEFLPGDASISPQDQQQLHSLVERLRKDKKAQLTIHSELGDQDESVARQRANPSPEDCLALAGELRARRQELASQQSALATQATAQLASGSSDAQSTTTQLRDLDLQIAQTDDAMDRLYDMLRPGAENQADRRTRAACIDLAGQRLNAVKETLAAGPIDHFSDRVNLAPAGYNSPQQESGGVVIDVIQKESPKQ